MLPIARVSVWKPDMSACLVRDAAYSDCVGGHVKYEDTPAGCGAGEIGLGLHYEEIFGRGYWRDLNIVEISTVDDTLQHPIATSGFTGAESAAGAVAKIYVTSTLPYDPAQGEDGQQLFLDDGRLTMGLPVVNVATDATGAYCAVRAPLTMPGNPATIAAYGVGTLIGRRRYAGVIRGRNRPYEKEPKATITLGPLSDALGEAYGGYTVGGALNVDVTTAIQSFLVNFFTATPTRWPQLVYNAANFASLTGFPFTGQRQNASAADMVTDALKAIGNGDRWFVRVGHDRAPRLVRLYTSSTNSYAYTVSLSAGTTTFEPLSLVIDDQDASQEANSVLVLGGTNPATQQPYSAIVQDAAAIADVGRQIDAAPQTVTALMSDAACAAYGQGWLNQFSTARSRGTFRVHTRNDVAPDQAPQGIANGDCVRGVQCVTVGSLDGTGSSRNLLADSEIQLTLSPTSRWITSGTIAVQPGVFGASNGWRIPASGSASSAYAIDTIVVPVSPGDKLVVSGYISARTATGPAAGWYVESPDYAQVLGSCNAVNGTAQRVSSGVITIPPGYAYGSVVVVAGGVGTIPGAQPVDFAQPQIERGTVATAYVPNYATPNPFGLVSSAVSTIDFAQLERYQDISFAAVEPDWTAVLEEGNNATATSLHANTGTAASIDSYVVSPSAFPPTISTGSLVVGTPAFYALFALGSAIVAVPANASAFTLPTSTTTWAWLNPNGTWTLQGVPTTVAGAIPYGYFTTSATGVLGFTPLASIGVYDSVLGAFSFAGMPASIQTNGPTVASVTIGSATTPGAGVTMVPLTIQIDAADYGGTFGAIPNWMDDLVVVMRKAVTHELLGDAEVMPPKANGTYNPTVAIPAGVAVDVGCYWKSHKGSDFSAKTWPPALFGLSSSLIAAGTLVGGGQKINNVVDAAFTHGLTYFKVVGDVPTVFPPQQTAGANPYPYVGFATGTGKNGTVYSKPFTPVPGQVYTLSCQAHGTSTGTVKYGIVDLSDYNAGHIPPTSVYGNGGALHTVPNANEYFTTYSWTCPTSGYPSQVCFAFTYTNASAPFLFQLAQIEPNAQATGFVNGPLTTNADGGGTLEHVSLPGSVTNNFDSGGNARRSSGLNTLPGILPVPSNFVLTFNFPSGSSSMTYWIGGGGVSGTSVTFYLPDGTTFTAPPYYSSGSPNSYNAGATGQTVYALAYFSKSSNTWSVSFQTSAFSASAVAAAFADGYVALVASYTSAAALTGTTGSGSGGSARGGTGGRAAA